MSRRSYPILGATAVATILAVLAALPVVAQQEEETRPGTRIHIERDSASGDEGRHVARHQVIFVDEDGEVTEIEGEGGDFSWFDGRAGGRRLRMHMPHFLGGGGFLGVATTPMTPELREHFGAPVDAGVLVSQVLDDSAAFRAGLRVGDVLTHVEGEPISGPMDLMRAIRDREEGDSVTLDLIRGGRAESVSALLEEREGASPSWLGLPRRLRVDCEEEGGDCDLFLRRHLDICGEAEECDVSISCAEDDCECIVNGVESDCEELHGVHVRPRP